MSGGAPPRTSFLRRRRVAITLALSALVALLAAISTVDSISLAPPSIHRKPVAIGAASTYLMLDTDRGLVGDRAATSLQFGTYAEQATLFSNLMASQPVQDMTARLMHISPDRLTARSRVTGVGTGAFTDTLAEQRANQLVVANRPYKLEMQADPDLPNIAIYGQAPTPAAAVRLVDTSIRALREFIAAHPTVTSLGRGQPIVLRQLGSARGETVNSQETKMLPVLAFVLAFFLSSALMFGGVKVRRGFIAAGRAATPPAPGPGDAVLAPAAPPYGGGLRRLAAPGGDWPRTTRVMPWLIAGFLVVIWLVPFNDIQLSANLPFDLKFDRIVLPVLLLVWILSIAAGGAEAPRPRLTRIHVGFLAFVAVVGLGIVLNASSLNEALEFNLATKKMSLLFSYGLMFAIIASTVRRSELSAFFTFSLVLAVIVAAGSIWEYRFHFNIFYDLSSKILGSVFQVTPYNPNQIDELGRRMVRGPSDHPLELVGMLVMMFPLALVGVLRSERRRDRVLYGIAACLLMASMVSTDRKSSLLAPLAVVLTVGYFYRRKLLRLAPLLLVVLIAIHILSPGALGTVVNQLDPSHLGVSTVSDRTSDYDAVRPDVWSHLAFGRGYGTYDHLNYRTLDSDMLNRLIDTGVLGVCAFIFMMVCVVSVARRVIGTGDRARAPMALAVAGSTVAYFVLTFLFDVSSFPHVPYIWFSLAGLLAAGEAEPLDEERFPELGSRRTRRARDRVLGHGRAPERSFAPTTSSRS